MSQSGRVARLYPTRIPTFLLILRTSEYLKNPPVEDSEYIQRACIEFKKNFSEVFKEQPESLSDMSEFLHEQLSQAVNDLQEGCTYQKPLCEPFDKSGAERKI